MLPWVGGQQSSLLRGVRRADLQVVSRVRLHGGGKPLLRIL